MKDKIYSIMSKPTNSWDDINHELTALMCYQEVAAFWTGFGFSDYTWDPIQKTQDFLIERYPKDIIIESIEKFTKGIS